LNGPGTTTRANCRADFIADFYRRVLGKANLASAERFCSILSFNGARRVWHSFINPRMSMI